jgi:hypothetical protein
MFRKATHTRRNRESSSDMSRSEAEILYRSDYFTKYQWADLYGDHKAHGFYADGSTSNGTTLGFWTIFSNLEGYTGGPLRSDLVVDTNIYNCG